VKATWLTCAQLLVTNKNKLLNVTVSKITSANARHGQTVS